MYPLTHFLFKLNIFCFKKKNRFVSLRLSFSPSVQFPPHLCYLVPLSDFFLSYLSLTFQSDWTDLSLMLRVHSPGTLPVPLSFLAINRLASYPPQYSSSYCVFAHLQWTFPFSPLHYQSINQCFDHFDHTSFNKLSLTSLHCTTNFLVSNLWAIM